MASKSRGGFLETVKTIVYAVAIAMVIRTFAYEPFNIPSRSMAPTLLVGDFLFVSKLSYGYSKHSIPLSPDIMTGRIFESPPERGDVVVFKLPSDNETDYIKRVIGLPGDRVQMRQGQLFINDRPAPRERVEDFEFVDPVGRLRFIPQYRETLPNGRSYLTLDRSRDWPLDNTDVFLVPLGHYFVMGDNRDNSTDSRVPARENGVGMVPSENLVGRADILFFSIDTDFDWWRIWKLATNIRYSRLGNLID